METRKLAVKVRQIDEDTTARATSRNQEDKKQEKKQQKKTNRKRKFTLTLGGTCAKFTTLFSVLAEDPP